MLFTAKLEADLKTTSTLFCMRSSTRSLPASSASGEGLGCKTHIFKYKIWKMEIIIFF